MSITIEPLNLPGVHYVAKNMRASDWVEVSNLVPRHFCTVDQISMLVIQNSPLGFVLCLDGLPAVVVQLVQIHDGAWRCGMFATDRFPLVWRSVIKEIKAVLMPTLYELEARYLEAWVLNENKEAMRFLRFIGFRQSSKVLTNYGAFGKDFVLFSLTKQESAHVFIKPRCFGPDPSD